MARSALEVGDSGVPVSPCSNMPLVTAIDTVRILFVRFANMSIVSCGVARALGPAHGHRDLGS